MTLNPETQKIVEEFKKLQLPSFTEIDVAEARKQEAILAQFSHPKEPLAKVEDRTIPGTGGPIPIRIYTPFGVGPFPILLYFHSGGWVLGDLESQDSVCRILANGAECVVVSVDYRLAPEHKFPAAAEDAYTATLWAAKNAEIFNGDSSRIAVSGLSAGGNLAAVVALMARDRGEPSLIYQLLLDPVTQYGFDTESYRKLANDFLVTKDDMVWYWHQYLPSPQDGKNPYASPLFAEDLSDLPPALIVAAECDVLHDDGKGYSDRLRDAGVPVKFSGYEGTIHAFIMGKDLSQAREALAEAVAGLRAVFN